MTSPVRLLFIDGSIRLFIIDPAFTANSIGPRVVDRMALLKLITHELRTRAHAQGFDGRDSALLDLPSEEAAPFVLGEYGPRDGDEARYHVRDGERYLKREFAFPSRGCSVMILTVEYYREIQDRARSRGEETDPEPLEGTTHVLLEVFVPDETTGKADVVTWAARVADELPPPAEQKAA